jgi:BRCT domain, a BRCA1 C-terminus domain
MEDDEITHVILGNNKNARRSGEIRALLSKSYFRYDSANSTRQTRKLPRIVTLQWVFDCVREATRLDESRYAPDHS